MNEWIISAGGAAVAYVGGLLTKPLQTHYQERRDSDQLRRALYVEISGTISHISLTVEELKRDPTIGNYIDIYVKKLWPCQCFEFAKTKPVVLNLLKDNKGITSFYGGAEALFNGWGMTVAQNKPRIWFASVFVIAARGLRISIISHLDKDLLIEVGDDRVKYFIQDGLGDIGPLLAVLDSMSLSASPPPAPPQP
jgi:hypothetical protein